MKVRDAFKDLVNGTGASAMERADFAAERIGRAGSSSVSVAAERSFWASANENEVWDIYDGLGEVRNAVAKQGRVGGHARLLVHKVEEDGRYSRLTNADRSAIPAEIVPILRDVQQSLQSQVGGQRGLIERFIELIKVGGYMEVQAIRNGRSIVALELRSSREVKWIGSGPDAVPTLIKHPAQLRTWSNVTDAGTSSTKIDKADIIGQIWKPHPSFLNMPVSSLYAMRSTCNQLLALQASITNRIRSRAAMNGMHFFRKGLTNVHVPDSAPQEIRLATNPLAKIAWHMQQAALDPMSPMALAGIFIEAEDVTDAYRFEDNERKLLEGDLEMASTLLERIIDGLDTQRSAVVGNSDSNHFSAWADDADEMRSNIEPELQFFCHALTKILLNDRLPAEHRGNYAVYYDISDAQTQVNKSENAKRAVEAGEAAPRVLAEIAGVQEHNKADDGDKIRLVGHKVNNPVLALYGVEAADDALFEKAKEWQQKTGPGGDVTDSSRPKSAPGVGEPGSPGDSRDGKPSGSKPTN